MDAASILIAIGLAFLVGAFIARPLLVYGQRARARPNALPIQLMAEREATLTALRELDFDHTTGKVADEDYTPQRAALVARGVAILQELDELAQAPAFSLEDQLEAEVRAARARGVASQPVPGFCPHCGASRHATDRFCAKCGAPLAGAV